MNLRQRRDALIEQARAMHTAAAADGRGFTAEEQAAHDALLAQVESINRTLEANAAMERLAAVTVPETQTTATAVASGQPIPAPAQTPAVGTPTATPRVSVTNPTRQKGQTIGAIVRGIGMFGKMNPQGLIAWAAQVYGENSPEYHALNQTEFSAGGALVPVQVVGEVIELLRTRSVIMRMNPRTLQLVSGVAEIPKITAGATASYSGENDDIGVTGQEFGQLKLTEKYLTALVPVSNRLMRNASASVDLIVRDDLIAALTERGDQAAIRGLGDQNSPKGLRYWAPPANLSASAGTALANVRSDIRTLIETLEGANCRMLQPGWLMASRTKNYMQWDLTDGNGNLPFQEQLERGTLNDWPVGVTNHVPKNLGGGGNESELYLVDFADFVVGESEQLMIDVSSEATYVEGGVTKSAFQKNQTLIRAMLAHDFGMRHDASVAVKTGVTYGA
ncbi:phage major capsid protein [Luteitalea sp.]